MTELTVVQGNITECDTDAIVNAANNGLLGGFGVDGAIHAAAGPGLLAECQVIRDKVGLLPTGLAVTTSAHNLPSTWIIHTVGPIWHRLPVDAESMLCPHGACWGCAPEDRGACPECELEMEEEL